MTAEESTYSKFGQAAGERSAVADPGPAAVAPPASLAHRHPIGVAVVTGLTGLVVGAFGAATLIGLWAPPPPPGWGPPPPPPGAWGPPPPPFAWHPPPPPPGAFGFPPPAGRPAPPEIPPPPGPPGASPSAPATPAPPTR